ncbi:MAG: 4Fe-4S dicluster domain-containing protein [Gemmatimonadota bacterium]
MSSTLDTLLIALAALFLVGLLAAAWTSAREREPRAAAILGGAALLVSTPFVLVGLSDFEGRATLATGLLGLTGAAALAVLVPGGRPLPDPDDTPRSRIDERDIMFSRMLLQPGAERFRAYYAAHPDEKALDDVWRANPGLLRPGSSAYHPVAFRAADASFATIERLRPFVGGEPAAERVELDPDRATSFLKQWARKLGAVSVGVTRLEAYHLYTHVGRGPDFGRPVTLDHDFALALTVEMDKGVLDHAPLAPTVMESSQQYVASGVIAVQLAELIRRLGYPARAHIDGNYRVVCPLVARDAGLGEIGRMGLLLTPRLGPRVRIAVVTTDLPLVPDPRRPDPTVIDFCDRCRKCAEACPGDAIPFGTRRDVDGVRRWQIDSEACFTLWTSVGTDCARCMAVCPYSHPANWMHDLVRWGVRRSGRFRRVAVRADDWLYGRRPPPRPTPEWMNAVGSEVASGEQAS